MQRIAIMLFMLDFRCFCGRLSAYRIASMAILKFNEDTRVKVPVILQLIRLGYDFVPSKEWRKDRDDRCNVLRTPFFESFVRLNPGKTEQDAIRFLENTILPALKDDDLGKQFYRMLTAPSSGERLVNFDRFESNTFQVATEVDCTSSNGDEFRPDVTIFINGLPLAFYEVKIPNNKEGMLAERERMGRRCLNSEFRPFINLTQLMLFSNNMEYDEDNRWVGSFYCTAAKGKPPFNFFREPAPFTPKEMHKESEEDIQDVLRDTNMQVIKDTPEFRSACDPSRPALRFASSLLCKERLGFFLKLGIAYVDSAKDGVNRLEKHIMRYPQYFASLKIRERIEDSKGGKLPPRGVIWHTQGSGKTALAYFSVRNLTDYYNGSGIVPKFFFIVDRIDLANQAADEFRARGLQVVTARNGEQFQKIIENPTARTTAAGALEIVVVNIQKFSDQTMALSLPSGDQTQRIFFIDEAHRSYNSKGSFLASLIKADPKAIHLGLTGTPRLVLPRDGETPEDTMKRDADTKAIFGGYIDAYYYNQSIQDGYTLRLIHEVIETEFRSKLQKKLEEIPILKGEAKKKGILYSHTTFVAPLVQYIVEDLQKARVIHDDQSIGGMIVCDSSEQARKVQAVLQANHKEIKSALILCDDGTKQYRKDQTDKFKNGELDFLVVYNMLLTGFDAPRLKKLYLGRIIKDHSLLQTLARVNRPYKEWNYGYVVDFADISAQFDKANKAYMAELQKEMGGDWSSFSNLFKSHEEIAQTLDDTRHALWKYDITNLEEFSDQLVGASREELVRLHRLLAEIRNLRGSIIAQDFDISHEELERFIKLDKIVAQRLAMVRWQQELKSGEDTDALLDVALTEMFFSFHKVDEKELKVAGELEEMFRKIQHGLNSSFDQKSATWSNLYEELKRIFGEKGFRELTEEEMRQRIGEMIKLEELLKRMKHEDDLLLIKFDHDAKYARLYRRLMEYVRENEPYLTPYERSLCEALGELKHKVDDIVEKKSAIVQNNDVFQGELRYCIKSVFDDYYGKSDLPELSINLYKFITATLANEYKEQAA